MYLGSEEGSGGVDEFTSDDDNLLSGENLLGDDGGESTQKVTLSVNNLRIQPSLAPINCGELSATTYDRSGGDGGHSGGERGVSFSLLLSNSCRLFAGRW